MIPSYPLLFLYTHNLGQGTLHTVAQTLVAVLVAAAAVAVVAQALTWGVARLVRDRRCAAALVSAAFLWFFGYGHLVSVVESIDGLAQTFARHTILFPLSAALFALVAVALVRHRGRLAALTQAANAAAVVLLAVATWTVGAWALTTAESAPEARASVAAPASAAARRPDIYYVILDAYGGEETLRELYGYDNRPFLAALRDMGFIVVDDAVSNYAFTRLSLASSLNLRYIHDELLAAGDDARRWRAVARLLKRNAVMSILRAHGYSYIHVRSGNDVTDRHPHADINIGCGHVDEFWSMALQSTILQAFDFANASLAADGRARILCQFEALQAVAAEKSPKFVFVHFILPHPPFFFDADGGARPQPVLALSGDAAWRDRSLYRDAVIFANRRILAALKTLLATSPTPPVIILQGDHGPASLRWSRIDRPVARERLTILNTMYLPGLDPTVVYSGMTPVNTFRLIFGQYLRTATPPLEDRAFFSTPERAYDFLDVTEWLR